MDGVQQDYVEFRADASRPLGPLKARVRIEYSPDSYAATEQAWWFEGQLAAMFKPSVQAGTEAYAKWMSSTIHWIELGCGLLGAVLTIIIGRVLLARAAKRRAIDLARRGPAVDLAASTGEPKKE